MVSDMSRLAARLMECIGPKFSIEGLTARLRPPLIAPIAREDPTNM